MTSARKRVLWVDDEIEYLRSHILFLESRGYTVIPVYSGDDAIELVKEKPKGFDIVLLDEQMPGKNGIATLEKIKEINPDLPVVMVTKSEEESLMEDAIGRKIDGYLTKPVNPSQILMVCKKILDSKKIVSTSISQKYIRSYTEIRALLNSYLTMSQWIKIYEELTVWDLLLDSVENEGLRQTHAGFKSECNAKFCDSIIENYPIWLREPERAPLLSTKVIEKFIHPLLSKEKKVYLVILSGMRLDQYVLIEEILKKNFNAQRNYFFAALPPDDFFARATLFSGMLPKEIAEKYASKWHPSIFDNIDVIHSIEELMLEEHLKRLGVNIIAEEPWFIRLSERIDPETLLLRVEACENNRLIAIVVNFFEQLNRARSTSGIMQELINDEKGMRELSRSWFEKSALFTLLRKLAEEDCFIVVMADHGHILCTIPTELYCVDKLRENVRYAFGQGISCDERTVVFLPNPIHFGLPSIGDNISCIIARENYYFSLPEKTERYTKSNINTFQQGGISMEEIIVPIGIFSSGDTK
ncbi:MAG: bifunctional response regulator/alkaline phosphatase family protein [Chitinispirillaceae bacterium]|nr:bifunctional response regulator/alkaline phosphatase family protein [Chitinispirillaceae bacterium]